MIITHAGVRLLEEIEMKITRHAFLVALATSITLPAIAEEQSPIIVTATRTAQTANESLATVSVINRDDIETSQAISVTELLRTQAGIHISTQGGYGKSQAVFVRGTEAGHMLVLIDGIRAASATTGEFAWESIATDQIEKIEIVYGPRTSLYGSDAIGGVINISTRKADHSSASISYGSFNTKRIDVATGGGTDIKYSLSAGSLETSGFPTRDSDTEDFGHTRKHVTAAIESKLTANTVLEARINHSESDNEHDSSTGDSESTHRVISMLLNNTVSNSSNQKLVLGHTLDEYTSLSPFTPSTITTKRKSASWQYDLYINDNITTFGVDYWQDHATKDNSGLIDETINNKALFVQQQIKTGSQDWVFNLRTDKHSEFGNETTGSLAWGNNFDSGRLVASYGSAFKAPSINDLFWPYSSYFDSDSGLTFISEGNLGIQPETAQNLEISWRSKPSKSFSWSTSIYRTEVDDLIDWQGVQTGPTEYTYRPTNLSSVVINGLDANLVYRVDKWQLDANLTLLNAKNKESGEQLDRRPKASLSTTITRHYNNKQFSVEWFYASKRNDRSAQSELDAYNLFNFKYSHDVSRSLQWNLRIENVADTEYTLAQSSSTIKYVTPERSGYIGMTYKF